MLEGNHSDEPVELSARGLLAVKEYYLRSLQVHAFVASCTDDYAPTTCRPMGVDILSKDDGLALVVRAMDFSVFAPVSKMGFDEMSLQRFQASLSPIWTLDYKLVHQLRRAMSLTSQRVDVT